jgi:fructose/tagatose bisphosphate aldolase
MGLQEIHDLLAMVNHSLVITDGKPQVKDIDKLRSNIFRLAEVSALETGIRQGLARYLVRMAALAVGAIPASINDLYFARGRGEVPPSFSVPALNLRAISFDAARAVFRVANKVNGGTFIFEIARSEMGYTDQRPAEYATSILAAAIMEGYKGPVFIQGDHFQVSVKKFAADPQTELSTVRDLIREAIVAGFYNIDVDTSTLVDLSKVTVPEQQTLNTGLSAELTAYIRSIEPKGITISVGGEIGEVGGHNSNEEELRAYMDGYNADLAKLNKRAIGISKISIQTGTSHGGVVLPDGSIAKVSVDFDTMLHLSQVARKVYGLGGAVQHGASTLPDDAFGKFVEHEACEVHLATNFQNMLFDRLPTALRQEMYAYLDVKSASERKPDMTNEQFYYKTRKNVIGPFKAKLWGLQEAVKGEISKAWEDHFYKLFTVLGVIDTRKFVEQTIKPGIVYPLLKDYVGEAVTEQDVSDLAD